MKKGIPLMRFELYKKDRFGSFIVSDYLGIESENGLVISMIKFNKEGGTLEIANPEPHHWKNYLSKV